MCLAKSGIALAFARFGCSLAVEDATSAYFKFQSLVLNMNIILYACATIRIRFHTSAVSQDSFARLRDFFHSVSKP